MQLRSLTFWNLGSLATADWAMLSWLAPWTLALMGALLWQWRALNALLLGEREALHLGFELQRLRARLILLVTLLVGPLVAVTGIIGFVGLIKTMRFSFTEKVVTFSSPVSGSISLNR